MRDATFFFREGGVIKTRVPDNNTPRTVAQRMSQGGYIVGTDSFWDGPRHVAINLSDVSCVIVSDPLDQE